MQLTAAMSTASCSVVASSIRVLLLLTVGCVCGVGGAAFMSIDPCPVGVAPGETWIPDIIPGTSTPAVCMKCSCFSAEKQGYSCYTCGVMAITLTNDQCYVTKSSPHAPYPTCCSLRQVCPNDPDYDPNMAGTGLLG